MNEHAKRAIEVAGAGDHSICIIGDEEAEELAKTYEKAISCRSKEELPKADLYVEVNKPTFDEWKAERKPELSEEVLNFLETAYKRLDFDSQKADNALLVARTIAIMASSEETKLEHLAEAIQYKLVKNEG